MARDNERLDKLRRDRGALPEHVVDEYLDGHLSRRSFVQKAALVGLALPTIGGILAACDDSASPSASGGRGKAGAVIKAGCIAPSAAPNPLTIIDIGGIQTSNQVSEALVYYGNDNVPRPWLATKWDSNADGSVWRFKIRDGVKFNDGSPMTVDDIVYTYQSHADPKNASGALSEFSGLLKPSGVVKVDDQTVEFNLEVPFGAFPQSVSQANYNAVVVPKDTDYDKWAKTFIGTGPFKMVTFNQKSGATFARNPYYWGNKVLPKSVEIIYYADEQPAAAALQGWRDRRAGSVHSLEQPPTSSEGAVQREQDRGQLYRALSMRCDEGPMSDKRVRQAIALTLDREAIISALYKGNAALGNDSPFAPTFPMTDKSIPQREQDLNKAKKLLAEAGVPQGFSTELFTERLQEMPQFAQIVAESAAKIGVKIKLNVLTISDYYGDAVFGKSPWLDGAMSLVDYGAVPSPAKLLRAPLQTTNPKTGQGPWNAAHFSDSRYDKLSREFLAAVDLSKQRELASEIQTLLLDQTPVIYPYFFDFLSASRPNVYGVRSTAGQQFYLDQVSKS